MSVVLRRGQGAKLRFNGKHARVLDQGFSGWTQVSVIGETVKWRTGHWEAEATAPILLLPADAMAIVMSRLELADVCRCMRVAAVFNAAANEPMTWADADLLAVRPGRQLAFISFLVGVRARIRSLRVHIAKPEVSIFCVLLQTCGATLRECDFRIVSRPYVLRVDAQAIDGAIDVDSYRPLEPLPVPPTLQAAGAGIAQLCAALEGCRLLSDLSLGTPKRSYSDAQEAWPKYPTLRAVRRLDCFFPLAASVHAAIAGLPALEHLIVKVDYAEQLELRHARLKTVDMRASWKGATIRLLACPNLEAVLCGEYHAYGNGLVLVNPYSQQAISFDFLSAGSASHRRFDPGEEWEPPSGAHAPLDVLFAPKRLQMEEEGTVANRDRLVTVPSKCVVSWTNPAISATGATPMIGLYQEVKMLSVINKLASGPYCHTDGPGYYRNPGGGLPLDMVQRFQAEALAFLTSHREIRVGADGVWHRDGAAPRRDVRERYEGGLLATSDGEQQGV